MSIGLAERGERIRTVIRSKWLINRKVKPLKRQCTGSHSFKGIKKDKSRKTRKILSESGLCILLCFL